MVMRVLWLRGKLLWYFIFYCVVLSALCSGSGSRKGRLHNFNSDTEQSNSRRRKPLEETYQQRSDFYYSNYGDKPSNSKFSCKLVQIFQQNVPAGYTNETIIPLSKTSQWVSTQDCVRLCCSRGRRVCQYAWLFRGQCFAVKCATDNWRNCLPRRVKIDSDSLYLDLGFRWSDSNKGLGSDEGGKEGNSDLEQETHQGVESSIVTMTTTALQSMDPLSSFREDLTTPTPTPTPERVKVSVSFEGETELTLPSNSTYLTAVLSPEPTSDQEYYYQWREIGGSSLDLHNSHHSEIWLQDLSAGVYKLKFAVLNGEGVEVGAGQVTVSVHPPKEVPPTPIIRPQQHLLLTLPTDSAVFDASGSHDGYGSSQNLTYHWEEEAGPDGPQVTADSAILQLHNLKQGKYKFKLMVTSRNRLTGVEYATVSVLPQPYYPPQAVAKGDLVIHLPKDSITIDGSRSKAYEGSLQYSWESVLRAGPLDMQGTSRAKLRVSQMSTVGDYVFTLKVTDSHGSSSSTNVSVVVLPERNTPPVSVPGPNLTVHFPQSSVSLNGSDSYDDYKITAWLWTLVSGPADIQFDGDHTPVLFVHGLHIDGSVGSPTAYQFQLVVWDYQNITDSASVTISYYKSPAILPVVSAGPDLSLILPQDTAIVNGSRSYDDFGIVSFCWVRSEDNPAAGLVIGGSERSAVLVVSGLVVGVYQFTLTVTNRNNLSASDTAIVTVFPSPFLNYTLQLELQLSQQNSTNSFTMADQVKLQRVLGLMLNDITGDYDVIIEKVQPRGVQQLVEFYAVSKDNHLPLNATTAYTKLSSSGHNYHYPDSNFIFVKFEMKVCELPCSGHGHCDQRTHRCSCSKYWMENPFKANFGMQETNCEWSVFYVVLIALGSSAVLFFLAWLTCCCCMRKRRSSRSKRRVRYAILDRKHLEEGQEMLPASMKNGLQQTSLMLTESDTEEELLFESKTFHRVLENGSTGVSPVIRSNHRSRSSSRNRGGNTPS